MDRTAPDQGIVDAMNRVLAAEREAAEAIAAAQRSAESVIEAARVRRRQILETARRRASRMHVKAQARLEGILREMDQARGGTDSDLDSLRSLAGEALERLARRLTSIDHESR
jgi:vacuolar-type H+-ATPase subunit H